MGGAAQLLGPLQTRDAVGLGGRETDSQGLSGGGILCPRGVLFLSRLWVLSGQQSNVLAVCFWPGTTPEGEGGARGYKWGRDEGWLSLEKLAQPQGTGAKGWGWGGGWGESQAAPDQTLEENPSVPEWAWEKGVTPTPSLGPRCLLRRRVNMKELQLWVSVCDFRTFDNSALGQFVTTDLLIM